MPAKKNRRKGKDAPPEDMGKVEADQTVMDTAWEQESSQPEISNGKVDSETTAENQDSVEDWKSQCAAQEERVLRLHAEMENLRNRTARELADQRKYGCIPLLKDILPVIDNIDRAIESARPEDPSAQQEQMPQSNSNSKVLLEGFKLVRQQLLFILEQHHCKPIVALGAPFDPQYHEAILQQPSEDQPQDHVMMVSQVGYQLYDRVVRAAQVIVSSGPKEE